MTDRSWVSSWSCWRRSFFFVVDLVLPRGRRPGARLGHAEGRTRTMARPLVHVHAIHSNFENKVATCSKDQARAAATSPTFSRRFLVPDSRRWSRCARGPQGRTRSAKSSPLTCWMKCEDEPTRSTPSSKDTPKVTGLPGRRQGAPRCRSRTNEASRSRPGWRGRSSAPEAHAVTFEVGEDGAGVAERPVRLHSNVRRTRGSPTRGRICGSRIAVSIFLNAGATPVGAGYAQVEKV